MAPSRDAGASGRTNEGAQVQEKQQKQREKQTASLPKSLPPPSLVAIDNLLDAASAALPAGGLLHCPLFSLHDAMLAVEVGDPKLDAGARGGGWHGNDDAGGIDKGESKATTTATANLQTPTPTPLLLSPSEALQVLDGLVLAAEAAWHAGGCLGTTIGTCVFMLRPRLFEEKKSDDDDDSLLLLRALTLATRASVATTRSLVTRAGVSEDEDFQLFHQELPTEGEQEEKRGTENVDVLLKRAEEALLSPSSSCSPSLTESLGLSSQPTREEAEALSRRLRFRRATLRALRSAEALGGGGRGGGKGASRRRSSSSFSDLASSVAEALEALAEIEKEPKEEKESETEVGQDHPLLPLPWFDPSAARRELPPAPPRPDRQFDVSRGSRSWRKLLEDLGAVASFPESVAKEEGEREAGAQQEEKIARTYHLRGALRAVRAFALRGAGAVPRSALALVLGLALDANPAAGTATTAENSASTADDGDGDEKKNDDGDGDGDASGSDDDNPYISEGAVKSSLHLLRDDSILWAPLPSNEGGGGGGEEKSSSPETPSTITLASKFVEQATLGLQGWCVAALLNPARSRRRHRRCCEDWGHVHQHALNAEADRAFCDWLELGSGEGGQGEKKRPQRRRRWDWRLPAASPASSSSSPDPPRPLSPVDAAIAEHASMLSCWVEEQACRAQRDHLLGGFALDLYAPHEAASVLLLAEHLERRAEGAAGALAERCPLLVTLLDFGLATREEKGKGKESGARDKKNPSPNPFPCLLFPAPCALQAEADSRACAARKYVAGALLRAAAATMAESVAVPVVSGPSEKKEFSFAPRVPRAPEPFNSARDSFESRFSGGPLSKLTTPPQLTYDDYELAVGEALRAVSENNKERFSDGGGVDDDENSNSNKLTALFLLRLAKDACLLSRKALPDLAAASAAPWRKQGLPPPTIQDMRKRALSVEEEGALSRVLGMTAVSLGVLEKEEAEAEEKMRKGRFPLFEPSRLVVSWDASIHPLYPALKVKRK